jgi:hypothetical protein
MRRASIVLSLLLVALGAVPSVSAAGKDAISMTIRLALTGNLTASTTAGTFASTGAIADGGAEVGAGRFSGEGHLKTGEPNILHSTMTLTGAEGTLELQLVGSFGHLPAALADGNGRWKIAGGTGAYAGAHGNGAWTATADFRAAIAHAGPPVVTFWLEGSAG